ncbi:MAG: uridine diphosphate-N-acetylglucosamine-binding protein YvcK [Bacillota bacterium]|nr:uridine diphosphate-N-acetylglucosamine-binding protein YvcK [Bacillota bacterium]
MSLLKQAKVSLKWLFPGLKIKRWLFLAFFGISLVTAGVAIISDVQLELSHYFRGTSSPVATGAFLIVMGIILLIIGFRRMIRSLIGVILPGSENNLADLVFHKRQLKRGPKIVVIGGGTGLGVLLRGLKEYTSNITAIVTVSDDGGSSGRLRGELGILPPGDTRNCLLALADTESLMEDLFNHRFQEGAGLKGHNVGNLLLAAMTELTGDFNKAIQEVSKVLAIRGQVLPVTLTHVTLVAKTASGKIIRGETKITSSGIAIEKINLEPNQVEPLPEAIAAIEEADAIVLGPGSLYTSVIPNLLVKGIPEALARSKAPVIYVCNVMTQPGETLRYSASQHIKALINHAGKNVIDYVIANTQPISVEMMNKYGAEGAYPVKVDQSVISSLGVKLIKADLVNQYNLVRHDSEKLANVIIELIIKMKASDPLGLLEIYLNSGKQRAKEMGKH